MLFIQCKNCMATSESKGRFFLQNESIRITNRIDSNRELECSIRETAKGPALLKSACSPPLELALALWVSE